jgi:hypothetical protein
MSVKQHIGGRFIGVCVTEQHIHLKRHFSYLTLTHHQSRLEVKERPRPLEIDRISQESPQHSKRLPINQDQVDPCPQPEAWVPLNPHSRLKMLWHDQDLIITSAAWTWGSESRTQFTRLQEIVPISSHKNRQSQRYVIASELGLWTWRVGHSQPLLERLPPQIPQQIVGVFRDGDAWWLKTHLKEGYQAWPILLFQGLPRLLGSPQRRTQIDTQILVPISGRALRGKRDALSVTWGQHSYATAPLKSGCVLSRRLVALATSKEVTILYGPKHTHRFDSQSHLERIKTLRLPTSTEAVLCEDNRLILLGLGYGLLLVDIHLNDNIPP